MLSENDASVDTHTTVTNTTHVAIFINSHSTCTVLDDA